MSLFEIIFTDFYQEYLWLQVLWNEKLFTLTDWKLLLDIPVLTCVSISKMDSRSDKWRVSINRWSCKSRSQMTTTTWSRNVNVGFCTINIVLPYWETLRSHFDIKWYFWVKIVYKIAIFVEWLCFHDSYCFQLVSNYLVLIIKYTDINVD